MDFLRQQLAVVQERLAALSASQKLLTAALAVIVVMTMLYWGKVSASRDYVAVLPNALAGEELAAVTASLRSQGIAYTVEAGKVMVAADHQVEALGGLSFNQAIPANATNALDAMFKDASPWDSQAAFGVRVNGANERNLAAIFRTYPGVKQAQVVITDAPGSALSRREPRIAINLQTKGGEVDRRKIAAAARSFALNCVAGLTDRFMSVTVDMQPFSGDANGGAGGDALDVIRQYEAAEAEKLRSQFQSIAGVNVQVTAVMDTATRVVKKHSVDPKGGKVSEVTESERETSTPVAVAAPVAEPGVVANTQLDLRASNAPVGGGGGIAIEKIKESTSLDYNKTETEESQPAGTCHVVGATVTVPRSYFVEIWRRMQATAVDANARPTEDQLATVIDAQSKRIRAVVAALTQLKTDDSITIRDSFDLDPIVGGPVLAAASAPGAAANLALLATGHARELAIGVLAVTSLFMVSRMVKKAAPTPLAGVGSLNLMVADEPDHAAATLRRPPPKTIGGEEVAAEVGDGAAVMFGQEIDADVLETSQMIEQVGGFVKQNPDAAAQMIGRWMSRD